MAAAPARPEDLRGMPAILNHLAAHPVGKIDGPIVPAPSRKKLSDIIPKKDDWWHIYIDRQHHEEAVKENASDPGSLYDNEMSKGFQKAMLEAYTKVLDGDFLATEFSTGSLKFDHYEQLWDLVKSSVHRPPRKPDQTVKFGLKPAILADDVTTELVDGRVLLTTLAKAGKTNPISIIYGAENPNGSAQVAVNAFMADTPKLIDWAFKSFKTEITAATTKREQLLAIARLVRILHTLHYQSDGNGRLHIYLLLPRLLLQYGFGPSLKLGKSCSPDTLFGLFNGCFSLDQIVAFLWSAQQLDDTFESLDI